MNSKCYRFVTDLYFFCDFLKNFSPHSRSIWPETLLPPLPPLFLHLILIEPKLVFRCSLPSPWPTCPLIRSLLRLPFTVIGISVFIEPKLVDMSTLPANPGLSAGSTPGEAQCRRTGQSEPQSGAEVEPGGRHHPARSTGQSSWAHG